MTSIELNQIAKTLEDAVLEQGLSKAEIVMVAALLQARLMKALDRYVPDDTVVPGAKETPDAVMDIARETDLEVKVKSKSIKYDPVYDPPPPMSGDSLPPPVEVNPGKVLAKQGQACLCSACNSVVYTVSRDIKDGCKVDEFLDSFVPFQAGIPKLTRKIEIQNVDGNISTDCPSCKAHKMLYLVGKRRT